MTLQLNLRLFLLYGPILCFYEAARESRMSGDPSEISEICLNLQEMCAKLLEIKGSFCDVSGISPSPNIHLTCVSPANHLKHHAGKIQCL